MDDVLSTPQFGSIVCIEYTMKLVAIGAACRSNRCSLLIGYCSYSAPPTFFRRCSSAKFAVLICCYRQRGFLNGSRS